MPPDINIVLLRTARERAIGLAGMKSIPDRTVFVFPAVVPGTPFHSRGVLEPFDLAFVDVAGLVLAARRMTPESDVVLAPAGTAEAWEAKAGVLIERILK